MRINISLLLVLFIPVFVACTNTNTNTNTNTTVNLASEMNTNGSITMNLYYTGEGDNARAFAKEMEESGTADLIRAEEGNLKYEYFFPANDPNTVLLIDSWVNQEALDRHHETEMMAKIASLREKYDLHMRVERYIGDDASIPSSNGQFVRQ